MRRQAFPIAFLALSIAGELAAQGCDMMLRDGVFNTFNRRGTAYTNDRWHQAWCSSDVQQTASSASPSVGVGVTIDGIPIGLSFSDAQTFQSSYKTEFCGNVDRTHIDFATNQSFRKAADPALVSGYVRCREVETKGFVVSVDDNPDNMSAFTVTVRWVPSQQTNVTVSQLSFSPAVVTCIGDLRQGAVIRATETRSALCTRSSSRAVTVLVGSAAGNLSRTLPDVTPPPSDQQRVMAALPTGTILAWFNRAAIAAGWAICDGSRGTPDLRGRFVQGAQTAAQVGQTGGAETHGHMLSGKTENGILKEYSGSDALGALQKDGGQRIVHNHSLAPDGRADPASSIPPFAYVMFLMKM